METFLGRSSGLVRTPTSVDADARDVHTASFSRTLAINRIELDPVSDERFRDPPVIREYGVRIPASEQGLSYRALDAAGTEVARGERTTDVYGKVVIDGIADRVIGLEIVATIIPIETTPDRSPDPRPPGIFLARTARMWSNRSP